MEIIGTIDAPRRRRRAASVVGPVLLVALAFAPVLLLEHASGASTGPADPPPSTQRAFGFTFRAPVSQEANCNFGFGGVGTQECNGRYFTQVPLGPFCCETRGTFRGMRRDGEEEIELVFFVPGGEIRGTIPNAASDRFSVTHGLIGSTSFTSGNVPTVDAGEPGGPLLLRVSGTCIGTTCKYQFSVRGVVDGDFGGPSGPPTGPTTPEPPAPPATRPPPAGAARPVTGSP
jgi:hypothetical protein